MPAAELVQTPFHPTANKIKVTTIPDDTPKELSVMDPKHIGRVFIQEASGNEKLLDGAHFSNLDCKWYQGDGSIHPIFEKFRGKKMSMRFNFKNKDRFGKLVECSVSVLLPLGVGETGAPDWQGFKDAELMEREYGLQFGTFKGVDDPYVERLRSAAAAAFSCFLSPDKKYSEIIPYLVYCSYLYVMDDVIDTFEVDNRGLTYKELTAMFDAAEQVLVHDKDPETIPNELNIPQLTAICKYTKYIKKYMVDTCRPTSVQMFINDLVQTFKAVALAGSTEWEEYKSGPARESARRMHTDMRLWDSAGIPTAEIQQMVYGYTLDPSVESSYLYRHVINTVSAHIALVNDIVSYRKEVKEKHAFNVCLAKHTVGEMSLEDAFLETAKEADKLVVDLLETEKLMFEVFGKDSPYLKEALYLYKSNLIGHLQWYNYAMRYHGGLVLDIVVHPDSF